MENIIKDIRYGLRGLLKRPGVTYAIVSAGLLLVALLACYIPARRASQGRSFGGAPL